MKKIVKNIFVLVWPICYLAITCFSCSNQDVVKRNYRGVRPLKSSIKKFSPVKKKVTLLTFFNESPYGGDDLAVTATEELRRDLSETGEFIFDKQAAKFFGNSKEIYAGGGVKLEQLARKARLKGVGVVLFGRIITAHIQEKTDEIGLFRKTKSYIEAQVEIRAFDVNSKQGVYTRTLKGYADDQSYRLFGRDHQRILTYRQELLRYGVRLAVRKSIPSLLNIAKKLNWQGLISRIINNKIYINAGRESGIQVRDILKVLGDGEEIFDLESGALIGRSKGRIRGTIEVIDYFGQDGAIATLHSGGPISEGDHVELY